MVRDSGFILFGQQRFDTLTGSRDMTNYKQCTIYEVQFVRSADTAHAHLVTTALGRVQPFTRHQPSVSELKCRECGQHDTSMPAHEAADSHAVLQQNICIYETRRRVDWYTPLKMEAASSSKSYTPLSEPQTLFLVTAKCQNLCQLQPQHGASFGCK